MAISRGARAALVAATLAMCAAALPDLAAAAPLRGTPPDSVAVGATEALSAWFAYNGGRPSAVQEFSRLRDSVAEAVAARLGLDPTVLRAAWRRADRPHQVALMAALSQLGTPYRTNARTPGVGFDCSGLTSWAWAQAGAPIAHQSRTQIRAAARRTLASAQAGDFVYYPGHVMLYLGVEDAIVHAPLRGRPVEVAMLAKHRSGRVIYGDPINSAGASTYSRMNRAFAIA